ncbi:ABC transporter ATP-binding protein [Defluviitalea phaphyphila]|uniref:ABC transporter ATP-binding protein n=1 Tax=Defluviitalea phaphyphila TaxID=1473580 RepID=UPI00072FB33D|nr:ABC transporter ATP-binding protein [Defluviitalea phaphyphila]
MDEMGRNLLEINNITKFYGKKKGINNFSLNIGGGEVTCIVGPNGSGKSTSIKIISGVMKSNNGQCMLNKMNTADIETKKHIGYLEESPFLYEDLTVYQFINFVFSVKCLDNNEIECERLIKKFELWEYRNTLIKKLSMGMRKRVSIIVAIMNYPPLIILDEPTNGLDTKSVISLKEEILYAKKHNCIIIVSSHILDFLKQIGTNFVFLKNGEIVKKINYCDNLDLDAIYKNLYINEKAI